MRVGILGGTFDPIHKGHLRLADGARRGLDLERVLLVPAARQPLKCATRAAPVEHRLRMCALAAAEAGPWLEVSDVEARRPGPSYTYETLRDLRRFLGPDADLHFLTGADVLPELPHWREIGEVLRLATFVVATRPGHQVDLEPLAGRLDISRLRPLEIDALPVSATEVRRRLRAGEPVEGLVPPAVARYIEAHGLYRDQGDDHE